MIVAWGLFAVAAIFMELWLKPALHHGEWLEVSLSLENSNESIFYIS